MVTFLKHGPGNPRNSEGAFVQLKDGAIYLVYTRYCGDSHHDHASADLYGMISKDGGRTWESTGTVIKNDSLNVMSVSLLRLQDGRIAMVYLRKSPVGDTNYVDCRPMICFSSDEAETWSVAFPVTQVPPAYMTVNNDRLVQLSNGRLIIPTGFFRYRENGSFDRGIGMFFLSDDGGMTWRQSRMCCYPPAWLDSGLEEPGVIELKDSRLMGWFRTGGGCQYKTFSNDGGETWTDPVPASEFSSPRSPLSMKRNPQTGELFAVWNDYDPLFSMPFDKFRTSRTPLVIARSQDEGKTWTGKTSLENSPVHGYAYTAMLFNGDDLLLEYCCGGGDDSSSMLQNSKINVGYPFEHIHRKSDLIYQANRHL